MLIYIELPNFYVIEASHRSAIKKAVYYAEALRINIYGFGESIPYSGTDAYFATVQRKIKRNLPIILI